MFKVINILFIVVNMFKNCVLKVICRFTVITEFLAVIVNISVYEIISGYTVSITVFI